MRFNNYVVCSDLDVDETKTVSLICFKILISLVIKLLIAFRMTACTYIHMPLHNNLRDLSNRSALFLNIFLPSFVFCMCLSCFFFFYICFLYKLAFAVSSNHISK
jgi:hypothetical protein